MSAFAGHSPAPVRSLVPATIVVPAGEFIMGETGADKFATDTERPAHRVILEKPFSLGIFPVTVAEYRAFDPNCAPEDSAELPVVNISWHEATAYCDWLSALAGRTWRLPTEAEWEHACRAGLRQPFVTGDQISPADANFLYSEYGERIGPGIRTPVGRYPANALGLHDLQGNICEWIDDTWHSSYDGAPIDGSAWTTGGVDDRRVIRGGAWDYLPRLLRTAWRDSLPARQRRDNLGFRVAFTFG